MKAKVFYTLLLFCLSLSMYAQREKDVFKNKGFFNITKYTHYRVRSASEQIGSNKYNLKSNNDYGNSLQTVNGYFFSPKFSLGIGLGIENFDYHRANTLSIFLDTRYYLEDNYHSFYAFGNIGGFSKLGNTYAKGFMLGGGIGYKFFINSNKTLAMLADAGYYHRYIDFAKKSSPYVFDLTMNGFSFSIGMLF